MQPSRVGTAWLLSLPLLLLLGVAARGEVAAAKSGEKSCNRATFRVALDVGHTADIPGARSARGVGEYEFNLALTKQIEKKLVDAGFARTLLLVTAEPFQRGLFRRAARANNAKADLFLSIHHDSVPEAFLEKWEYQGEQHSYSDRFKGHSLFISKDNLSYRGSLQFGKLLGNALKARGLEYARHYVEKFMGHKRRILVDAEAGVYRYDQLVVLMATHMPAVLLEAGSIINRDEELAMASVERQSLIGDAVVGAVESFCKDHARRPAHTVSRPQPNPKPRRPKTDPL